uniref:Uncharacterized protein n=1 Tax=Lepeophtheirus salmonis TaxID=72036 RepID=A0A0K2V2T3_LEPSM
MSWIPSSIECPREDSFSSKKVIPPCWIAGSKESESFSRVLFYF